MVGLFRELKKKENFNAKQQRLSQSQSGRASDLCFLYNHGGRVQTTDKRIGYSVYEEVAKHLNVPLSVISQRCARDDRPNGLWRASVGYRRKDLVRKGYLKANSDTGVWELSD